MCRKYAANKLKLAGADRKSRHHYDLASIFGTPTGTRAIKNKNLAEKVRVAFRAPDDARPGNLRLMPPDDLVARLRLDYDRGASRMIFGDAPNFDWVVERLSELEDAINK